VLEFARIGHKIVLDRNNLLFFLKQRRLEEIEKVRERKEKGRGEDWKKKVLFKKKTEMK
jgi:hypothetical protein